MELSDLKSEWQNAGGAPKGEAELLLMTKVSHHPSLKKIKNKLIIETAGLVFLLLVYYDWFDGDKKPFFANVMLAASLLLYICNDVIGYIAIAKPIKGKNIKTSIHHYLRKIRRLSILSVVISFVYSISFILFFTVVVNFTTQKYLILTGIIITLITATYISSRMWSKWVKNLQQQVRDLHLDEEK